jgi:hypothetical protein
VDRSRATIYSIITGARIDGLSKQAQVKLARSSLAFVNSLKPIRDEPRRLTYMSEFENMEVKRQLSAQAAMLRFAELSGGTVKLIENAENAESIYSDIFDQICKRYVIGYYPINRKSNGNIRRIEIEVRNHPQYVITGRKTYLPDWSSVLK